MSFLKVTRIPFSTRIIILVYISFQGFLFAEKEAQVSSLKPKDLAEFDAQPEKVRKIITYALSLTEQELAYQYGSCQPSQGGLDCSGMVNHVLSHLGYRAPRQCNTIYLWVRKNENLNEVKSASSLSDPQLASLKPGDILFWEGTYAVGERFPATSHVMIYLGHRKSDGKPVMVGSSSGRYYNGKARHGVSVFDFRLPRKGSKSRFVGYGPVPGVKSLGLNLPPLKKPEQNTKTQAPAKPSVPKAKVIEPVSERQRNAVAKAKDSVTNEPWRYLVYLPSNYSSSKEPLPLILYLHGRSIRGRDLEKVKRYGPPALLDGRADFPFIVVSPQLPDGSWPSKSLINLLDELVDTYRIDTERIYLTGASMGGGGAWYLAAAAPDRFAALAPLCGYAGLSVAPELTGLPIRAFHGDADEIVPIKPHKELVEAINRQGGGAELSVIPGGTHGDIIMPVYKDESLYDWFLTHRRKTGRNTSSAPAAPTKTAVSKSSQPEVATKPPSTPPKRKTSSSSRNVPGQKIGRFLKKVFKQ